MAKKRDDDRNPKDRPSEEEPFDVLPLEDEDVQEVMEIEDLEESDGAQEGPDKDKKTHLAGKTAQPTKLAGQAPQPTMLAPQDESAAAQEKSDTPPEKPEEFAGMPNLSIDDDAEILAAEPDKPSGSSSIVEVMEVAEDVGDAHVLGTEAFQHAGGSSVVEIAEILPEGGSDVLAEEAVPSGSSVVSASVMHVESEVVPSGVIEVASEVAQAAPVSDVALPVDEASSSSDDVLDGDALVDDDESSAVDLDKPDSGALLLGDEGTSSAKKKKAQAAEEDAASALLSDEPGKEVSEDDLAAHALLDDEMMPATKGLDDEVISDLEDEEPAIKGDKEKAKAEDEEDAEAAQEEKEPSAKSKKGKKEKADEEEDEELVGAGSGQRGAKSKYGRGWLGGMGIGVVLVGAVLAGIWFVKPELIGNAYKSTSSQKEQPRPKLDLPPAVKARAEMENHNFAKAVDLLDTAIAKDKSSANLSTRAEARWRNYLDTQEKAKKALDKNAPEVKQVLDDLKQADDKYLLSQVNMALEDDALRASLKAKEKSLQELKGLAEKAGTAGKEAEKTLAAVTEVLAKEKLLDGKDKLSPDVLEKIVKDLSESKITLAAVNKLLEEAKIKDGGDKGVAKILTAKKDVEEKLDAVNKLLAEAKVKDEGAKGLQELLVMRDQLSKDRDELDQALKGAYKELSSSGIVPPNDNPRGQIVEAVKIVRQKAEAPLAVSLAQLANSLAGLGTGTGKLMEKSYDLGALTAELSFYRLREPFILSPEQKLDTDIVLLQDMNRKDANELALARREAGWVLSKEAKASPEARAKALLVAGLADRNMEKFDLARKNLEASVELGAKLKNAPWRKLAGHALKELTDPAVYFLPAAEKLAGAGKVQDAQDVLTTGLKAMPDNPRLMAYRGLIRLEAMRGHKEKLEAAQKEIRQDVEAAAKNGDAASEASFLLGNLEEELGNFDKAEDEYRKAIKASRGKGDDGSRYIIALARLLQRERGASAAVPAPGDLNKDNAGPKKAEPEKKDAAEPKQKEDDGNKKDQARLQAVRGLLMLALVGAQPPGEDDDEDPATAARIRESIELANQLIQSANPKIKGQGYLILGQALSKQGKRTDGLREYAKGLELLHPGVPSREMAKLLEEHPAFQQPDATGANPLLAEQFYGKGLHRFWSGNYREAEALFKQAVQFYKQDARYQYYLGLSLLRQKGNAKRDAANFALEQGAKLEAGNRPSMAEVNASLERLQGPVRAYLDSYRQKALSAAN